MTSLRASIDTHWTGKAKNDIIFRECVSRRFPNSRAKRRLSLNVIHQINYVIHSNRSKVDGRLRIKFFLWNFVFARLYTHIKSHSNWTMLKEFEVMKRTEAKEEIILYKSDVDMRYLLPISSFLSLFPYL